MDFCGLKFYGFTFYIKKRGSRFRGPFLENASIFQLHD